MPRAALLLALVWVSPGCSSGPVPNLKRGDPYERYLGALEISDSSDPADRKTLEGLLKDSDPLTRIGAIVAISQARTPDSLKLVTAMLADPDTGVRTEAVRAVA